MNRLLGTKGCGKQYKAASCAPYTSEEKDGDDRES